jgi:autotransporter passenger strand-loop-strand repeat protein
LFFGDTMEVFAGGSAVRTGVLHGAVLTLSGGTARGTEVGAGGKMVVSSGGTARGTEVGSGGEMIVSAGGTALHTVLSGEEIVSSGGTARHTIIGRGQLVVSSGGDAFGNTLSGFGFVRVEGGLVRGTAVTGGEVNVDSGLADATVIGSRGFLLVDGGVARGLVVASRGDAVVFGGGHISEAVISGGRLFDNGGSVAEAVIDSGGEVLVRFGGRIAAPVIGSGGEVFVLHSSTVTAPVLSGGSLELLRGSRLGGSIDFAGSGGSLVVARNRLPGPANLISGFAPGDTIDLAAASFVSAGSATLAKGNELQISEGGKTYTLFFDPKQDFSGFVFTWASDGHGGTLVGEEKAPAAAADAVRWFGATPQARPASPMLVDSGTVPGHSPPASLAHLSGGFGQG